VSRDAASLTTAKSRALACTKLCAMAIALVRPVPSSFSAALSALPPDPPISVSGAQSEHAAYASGLAWLGLDVGTVAADESCPDCCFIEDTAVLAGGVAVTTRPGAASRRAEVAPVAAALARHLQVLSLAEGTLDGGDCMRLGKRLFVGRTARSNEAGIRALARLLEPYGVSVTSLAVPEHVLHLKCVCSPLDDERFLLAEGTLAPEAFAGAHALLVPAQEAYAANVVAHGKRVLVADGFPRTRELLERAGFEALAIDNRELRKADSALTCLSIVVTE
jgi:dimethylargininase